MMSTHTRHGKTVIQTDKGKKKRSTKELRRESELRMIAEVVQLSKMFVEMPDRTSLTRHSFGSQRSNRVMMMTTMMMPR
jgi:hypothetical protein